MIYLTTGFVGRHPLPQGISHFHELCVQPLHCWILALIVLCWHESICRHERLCWHGRRCGLRSVLCLAMPCRQQLLLANTLSAAQPLASGHPTAPAEHLTATSTPKQPVSWCMVTGVAPPHIMVSQPAMRSITWPQLGFGHARTVSSTASSSSKPSTLTKA